MRVKPGRRVALSVFLAALLILASVTAVLAAFVQEGDVTLRSWDPLKKGWTTGENDGYGEGQTAVMSAELITAPGSYDLPLCLQIWEGKLPSPVYAFTGFKSFDTFLPFNNTQQQRPDSFPGGEPIDYNALASLPHNGFVYGYNLSINSVGSPAWGNGTKGNCEPNYIRVVVNFTRSDVSKPSYLIWGGHVAQAGNDLTALPAPRGFTDDQVPAGQSAKYIPGTFQGRLNTEGADKTLNFKVVIPTAVSVSSMKAVASQGSLAALAGVMLVGALGLFIWRRKS